MNASEAMSNMREMGADEDLMLAFAYLANHLSEFRTADGFLLNEPSDFQEFLRELAREVPA